MIINGRPETKLERFLLLCLYEFQVSPCPSCLTNRSMFVDNQGLNFRCSWRIRTADTFLTTNDFVWVHFIPMEATLQITTNRIFVAMQSGQSYILVLNYNGTVPICSCFFLCCSDRLGDPHIWVRLKLILLYWILYDSSLVPTRSLSTTCLLLFLCLFHQLNYMRLHRWLTSSSFSKTCLHWIVVWWRLFTFLHLLK